MNNQTMPQAVLPDADMAYTILADLKRVTREYATAATESVCPEIRQMFTKLTNDTLRMQGELYTAMQQNQMYNASSPAPKQELDKQLQAYRQTQQETGQFVSGLQQAGRIHPGAMNAGVGFEQPNASPGSH